MRWLLLALTLALAALPGCVCWQQVFPSGGIAQARMGHSSVSLTDSIILTFGGRTTVFGSINGTVEYSGSLCSAIGGCNEGSSAGTCARCDSGGCYCTCSTEYSGVNCEMTQLDTWLNDVLELDLDTESMTVHVADTDTVSTVTTAAWPNARYHHSAVIINATMIIYGGYSQLCGDYCNDLWQYAPYVTDSKGRGTWTNINATYASGSPGKRWQHTAVAYQSTMIVFGGHRHTQYFNDLWQLNTTTWAWSQLVPVSSSVPIPRLGHASAIDTERGLIYIYGGWNNNVSVHAGSTTINYFLSDFWRFNLTDMTWTQIFQPSDSTEMPGALLGSKAAMSDYMFFLFSGYYDNAYDSRIWRYNASSGYWTQHRIASTVLSLPDSRDHHSIVFLANRSSFFMFGGWGSASSKGVTVAENYYSDTWQLDLTVCPDDCNERGSCSYGYCFCDTGYFGTDCQDMACLSSVCYYSGLTLLQVCDHCNSAGTCVQGACLCSEGFTTTNETLACSEPFCPRQCSNNGQCVSDDDGGYMCQCNTGFYGRDCSLGYCTTDCNAPFGACNTTSASCQCARTPLGYYSLSTCTKFVAY